MCTQDTIQDGLSSMCTCTQDHHKKIQSIYGDNMDIYAHTLGKKVLPEQVFQGWPYMEWLLCMMYKTSVLYM
jgi:hypothetical protein